MSENNCDDARRRMERRRVDVREYREQLRNVAHQHSNAPHAVLISELRKEVDRFNKVNKTKFDIVEEVNDFFRRRRLFQ